LSELSAKLVAALSGRSFAAYNSLYDVPGFGQCRQCWGLRFESAGAPTLLWTQLTNFNDSAETPTLSRDGKRWHFCAAQAVSVLAANTGQVWIKSVPDGEPL